MKYLFSLCIAASFLATSCSNDDDATPEIVNDEEVITTLTVSMTPQGNGDEVVWTTRDLDGDGPNAPVVTIVGNLIAGTTYDGVIKVLNETENPAEDITTEVEEESNEHQFFYTPSASLNVSTTYSNFDDNGNPLGTQFSLIAGSASAGSITFTLRHEPTKPNTGLGDAGGETDIAATFNVTVQ